MRKPVATALAVVSALSLVLTGCGGAKTQPKPPAAEQQQTPPATTPEPPKTEPQTPAPTTPAPTTPAPEPAKLPAREMPKQVRGIMLSGWYAGSPDLYKPLLDWAKSAGINTVVLDIKAEDGKITWETDIPLAKEIGSNERKVGDIKKLMADLHERGFWVAGRIVIMNDQYLYRARPSETIPGFTGGAYSFMNPESKVVYDYNMAIAKAAVEAGVDEIQLDYIRYPYNKEAQPFINANTNRETRKAAINNFVKNAITDLRKLKPEIKVSVDVFGLTTSVDLGDDMKIGQDYREIAEIADAIAPMMYPSHYAAGTYGLANPNASPYETIRHSMEDALRRTIGIPAEKHRPWIQDFNYDGVIYGPDKIMAQVRALNDMGVTQWMLWDPSNKYTRNVKFADVNVTVPKLEPFPQPATTESKPGN
ncbi:MAG TPA: putative glycoside hydrolase [Symbiobacteriaceae bacterium]|nr:putative glycoside hydrolase [Symbiobacteriaceae bacterium]